MEQQNDEQGLQLEEQRILEQLAQLSEQNDDDAASDNDDQAGKSMDNNSQSFNSCDRAQNFSSR